MRRYGESKTVRMANVNDAVNRSMKSASKQCPPLSTTPLVKRSSNPLRESRHLHCDRMSDMLQLVGNLRSNGATSWFLNNFLIGFAVCCEDGPYASPTSNTAKFRNPA